MPTYDEIHSNDRAMLDRLHDENKDRAKADQIAASIGRSWMAQRLQDRAKRENERDVLRKLRAIGGPTATAELMGVQAQLLHGGRIEITDEMVTDALLRLGRR